MDIPLTISIMIGLEIITLKPANTSKEVLRMAYGGIRRGGTRRGIFIREIFSGAMINSMHDGLRAASHITNKCDDLLSGFLNYHRLTRTIEPAPIAKAPSIRRCSRSLKNAQAPRVLKLTTAILIVGKSCELCHPGTPSTRMRK